MVFGRFRHYMVPIILLGSFLIGTLLLWYSWFPYWGEAHRYHTDKPQLPLSEKIGYRQRVIFEREEVRGIMLSFESPLPSEGGIEVHIRTAGGESSYGAALFSSATLLGDIYVNVPPLRVDAEQAGEVEVLIKGTRLQAKMRYEIDSTKYKNGSLTRIYLNKKEEKGIQGNMAFTLEYRQRAFQVIGLSLVVWLCLGIIATFLLSWCWRKAPLKQGISSLAWSRNDWIAILAIIFIIGGLYGVFWFQTYGKILSAGDMLKDILYVESARQALLQLKMPYWHHFTCGGQPLIGNIEANVGSIMLPLALLLGSAAAFKMTLWLEVIIAGVGFYILARLLGQKTVGAIVPALLIPLGSFVSNRIFLGHTMFIGGVAFAPWAIIGFLLGRRDPRWGIITSMALSAMLGRGDTHVLLYVVILLCIWSIIWGVQRRTVRPIILLVGVSTLFLIMSSYKILPSLESSQHFHTSLPKLVAPLISEGIFDDVLLRRDNGIESIKVVHGELEGWENIGLYTGFGLIVAGFLGWFQASRSTKWLLAIPFIFFVVVGEGTMYELFIRKLPVVGALLRLPSRALVVPVWLLAISAGVFIQGLYSSPKMIIRIISILFLLFLVFDISRYTWSKLGQIDTLSYGEAKNINHALVAPEHNLVAPGACQDFNAPPSFISRYRTSVPIEVKNEYLQDVRASMSPNELTVFASPAKILTIYSAYSPLLQIENGTILSQASSAKGGALAILVTDPRKDIVITYISRTAYGALFLSLGGWLVAIAIILPLRIRAV